MENSNNTGKILVFFTAIVFLFFVYEVMTNTSKVSQVNVPQPIPKQPSEIIININKKNNNNNNNVSTPTPVPPAPEPPAPVPPAPAPPAPVPPAPVPPAPVPPAPVPPAPVTPASICNCRPIISSCGKCISLQVPPPPANQPEGEGEATPPPNCQNYNKNTCGIATNNCRWDQSDCSLCTSYTDESNCNSAQQDCFWGCTTR